MALISRCRSTTIVKLVAFMLAIWICIAFFIYTDYTRWHASSNNGINAFRGIDLPISEVELEAPINAIADLHALKRAKHNRAKSLHKLVFYEDEKMAHKQPPSKEDGNLGAMGKPVILPKSIAPNKEMFLRDGWRKNGLNQYVSDLVSVHRSLPDPRDAWCKDSAHYLKNLPKTDVIICFHNEAWSVLLRTVHSVLDRSPPELIGEIILVDDYSDMPHLKRQLEDYFASYTKVRIVRGPQREGLIRARLLGAKYGKSPVITYLDSHCECAEGWLEPLLDRIARNSTTVVCPVIDVIDDTTLEYKYSNTSEINVSGFDWDLQSNWHPVPERERKRRNSTSEPIYTPIMAGGLFSIDRKFFERLGTYDSGFEILGGDNLELSFKTWMCGGTLEIVPCSHVGHIFRQHSPSLWRTDVNVLEKNLVRLAEVWMDDYAKYYYQRIGMDKGDFGDVSERKKLRKNLQCKSFQWYLENIYPELFIPGDAVASGEIRNFHTNICIDAPKIEDKEVVSVFECHGLGMDQFWMFSKAGEIRRDQTCLDYAGKDVILLDCNGSINQFWTYRENSKQLRHGYSGKCLAINESKDNLLMEKCDASHQRQQWVMENYNSSKL